MKAILQYEVCSPSHFLAALLPGLLSSWSARRSAEQIVPVGNDAFAMVTLPVMFLSPTSSCYFSYLPSQHFSLKAYHSSATRKSQFHQFQRTKVRARSKPINLIISKISLEFYSLRGISIYSARLKPKRRPPPLPIDLINRLAHNKGMEVGGYAARYRSRRSAAKAQRSPTG